MITFTRAATRAALIGAALSACHWGGKAKDFEPAMTPAGARVTLRVRGERTDRNGELYAVDTTGVVIREQRVERVRWARLANLDVDKLGRGYDVGIDVTVVDAAHRARLAAVSRFPQGLAGPLLERVLSMVHQSAIEDVP